MIQRIKKHFLSILFSCNKIQYFLKKETTDYDFKRKGTFSNRRSSDTRESCVEKYGKYAEQARDPELKNLFRNIQQEEQKHYESLSMILSGSVPECNCNDRSGRDYQPKAVYTAMSSPEDKQHDAFLATDCIGTEKLVSGTYNDDVFAFGDSGVRKLLADIQIEEQNHAEMLYKYKTVNGMA